MGELVKHLTTLFLALVFLGACSESEFTAQDGRLESMLDGESLEVVDSTNVGGDVLDDGVVTFNDVDDGLTDPAKDNPGPNNDNNNPDKDSNDGSEVSRDKKPIGIVDINELFDNPEINEAISCHKNGHKVWVCHHNAKLKTKSLCIGRPALQAHLTQKGGVNYAGKCAEDIPVMREGGHQ